MENLEVDKVQQGKIYCKLEINEIEFSRVQLFISEGYIEIIDSWSGIVVARVQKHDIKKLLLY